MKFDMDVLKNSLKLENEKCKEILYVRRRLTVKFEFNLVFKIRVQLTGVAPQANIFIQVPILWQKMT